MDMRMHVDILYMQCCSTQLLPDQAHEADINIAAGRSPAHWG